MQSASESQFLILYGVLSGILILTLFVLFFTSSKLFREAKNEDVKDGGTGSLIMRGGSLVITIYLFIFQIPLFTVLFQGFLCDEVGPVSVGTTCTSSTHSLLILISTLMLIVYVIFLLTETLLFASNSFEILVPWASFERELAIIRQIIKFTISASLIFDKSLVFRGELNLALASLYFYMIARRCKDAIIFDNSVFYATIVYETLGFWLHINVSIHQLSGSQLSISSVVIIFAMGIIMAGSIINY